MSLQYNYEALLRTALEMRRVEESLRADGESRERVRAYGRNLEDMRVVERAEEEEEHQARLREVELATEKAIKETREKREDQEAKIEKDKMEYEKKLEEEAKKRTSKYEKINEESEREASKKLSKMDERLTGMNSENIKAKENLHETKLQTIWNVQTERDGAWEQRNENLQRRQGERIDATIAVIEQKKESETAVAKKQNEDNEQIKQLDRELVANSTQMKIDGINSLVIRGNERDNREMRNMMATARDLSVALSEGHEDCTEFFYIDFETNRSRIEQARESFKELSQRGRSITQHLNGMERELADVRNERDRNVLSEKIRNVKRELVELSMCVPRFIGRFMAKNPARDEKDEEKLASLIGNIVNMIDDFDGFNATNAMIDHLRVNQQQGRNHLRANPQQGRITAGEFPADD